MGIKGNRHVREQEPTKRINYKRLALICLPLVIATFVFVYYFRYIADTQPKNQITRIERSTISLIYPGNNGTLSENIIEIDSAATQKDKGNFIINELKTRGLVPEGTSLQEMIIDAEGIIYLNFTKDLLQGVAGKDDVGIVYAIVNSFLASFRYTKKVHILVDWKPVYTLRGTVYTYLPIEFNKQVMED